MQEEMYNGERRERDGPRGAALCQRGAVAWQRARTSYLTAPHKAQTGTARGTARSHKPYDKALIKGWKSLFTGYKPHERPFI